MNSVNDMGIKTDPDRRFEQKELQRKNDLADLANGKITRTELQKRNSIFTTIDWSEVEIVEPDGYHWKPVAESESNVAMNDELVNP